MSGKPDTPQVKKQPWHTGLFVHLVLLLFSSLTLLALLGTVGIAYATFAGNTDVGDTAASALSYALILALVNIPALMYVDRILRVYPHSYQYLSKDDPHPFNR